MTKRAAVYLRVSTRDQTLANQIPDLERLLSARGFKIAATYQDEESGARRRPELERLMGDAARHRFDVVAVWALDRLGRSMGDVVAKVLELERIGVELVSAREPWLDTTGPVRSLLVSIFAWVAEWERSRIVERTNAGIARARAAGVAIGRPSVSVAPHELRALLELEHSPEAIARHFGIGRSTLYRELRRLRELGAVPKGGAVSWGPKRRKSAARRSSP